MPSIITP